MHYCKGGTGMGNENQIEGRHSVLEAFRAGKLVERVFVLKLSLIHI